MPEFQDTYGWILFRRGDGEEAQRVLAEAAAALPGNALVQFHLAEAMRALDRLPEARAAYGQALLAADAGSPLPQADEARARIAEIDAPPPEAASEVGPGPASGPASGGPGSSDGGDLSSGG